MIYKLGKLPRKVKEGQLYLSKYIDTNILIAPPVTLEYYISLSAWTMMGNDKYGDCTCAGGGHAVMAWTFANNNLVTPSETSVLLAYTAVTGEECGCSGFNPVTDANDDGCACTDVLTYFQNTGIDGHKITGWATVATHDQEEIKQAIYLFGLVYIGIQMPISAQSQPTRWTVTNSSLTGNSAPGSWGGHCVIVVGYDADGVDVITWGQRIRMTWGFWKAYVDEAYALLSSNYFTNNLSPAGFNATQLQADLKLV